MFTIKIQDKDLEVMYRLASDARTDPTILGKKPVRFRYVTWNNNNKSRKFSYILSNSYRHIRTVFVDLYYTSAPGSELNSIMWMGCIHDWAKANGHVTRDLTRYKVRYVVLENRRNQGIPSPRMTMGIKRMRFHFFRSQQKSEWQLYFSPTRGVNG